MVMILISNSCPESSYKEAIEDLISSNGSSKFGEINFPLFSRFDLQFQIMWDLQIYLLTTDWTFLAQISYICVLYVISTLETYKKDTKVI